MSRPNHRWLSPAVSFALCAASCCAHDLTWSKLASIPDAEGFAGTFAGVSHGALIVAGGANIVGDKWGTNFHKQWYDSVFVLTNPQLQWHVAGKLPHPLGYGVSITTDDGVICIGGSDSTKHYADVFQLAWSKDAMTVTSLPKLPKPCANSCGAMIGHTIYVAGGLGSPNATNALKNFWSLDLSAKTLQWVELPPWPGPERMLAVAGVLRGEFYLISGARLNSDAHGKPVREYLKDAYAFSPANGWRKIADVPRPVTAAPSPAISANQLLILPGDDGSNVKLPQSASHPGFSHDLLAFDASMNQWSVADRLPFGRATAPLVQWNGHVVLPMGEVRPRERTPEVWWTPLPGRTQDQSP